MEEIIFKVMEDFGYIGVLLLIMAENLFPPIPSEVILTFAGFMTTKGTLNIGLMITVSTIGSLLGAIVLYYLGAIFDKERWYKIVDKWGKWLRLKRSDIDNANQWFEKHGNKTVFFCRFIPLIRSLISIPAGMANMKLSTFMILTTIGSLIWNTVLIYLGSTIGENWTDIVEFMDVYSNIAYAFIVLVFLVACYWFYKNRIKKTRIEDKQK